jgi:hypothetical protein
MTYEIRTRRHYRPLFQGSDELFSTCWRKWRKALADGLDDPCSDDDVIAALDEFAGYEVNDGDSPFYIYG